MSNKNTLFLVKEKGMSKKNTPLLDKERGWG
jgi:hypothetical protein